MNTIRKIWRHFMYRSNLGTNTSVCSCSSGRRMCFLLTTCSKPKTWENFVCLGNDVQTANAQAVKCNYLLLNFRRKLCQSMGYSCWWQIIVQIFKSSEDNNNYVFWWILHTTVIRFYWQVRPILSDNLKYERVSQIVVGFSYWSYTRLLWGSNDRRGRDFITIFKSTHLLLGVSFH